MKAFVEKNKHNMCLANASAYKKMSVSSSEPFFTDSPKKAENASQWIVCPLKKGK